MTTPPTPTPAPDKKIGGIKGWLQDLIGNLVADPRVQQAVKNVLGALITERILPLVPVAAASAAKAAVDELVQKFPQLAEVIKTAGGIEHDVVSVVNVANTVRNDLNALIPDFNTGIPQLNDLMDFWRPK